MLSFNIDTVAPAWRALRGKHMYSFSSQILLLFLAISYNVFFQGQPEQLDLPLVKVLHFYREVS